MYQQCLHASQKDPKINVSEHFFTKLYNIDMYNKLEVQKFLETKSFGDLFKEWGINANVSTFGHKFSLKYDMIAWKPGHKPSEQCRGLILSPVNFSVIPTGKSNRPDENFIPGPTTIFAYPMDKFYNSVEVQAPKVNWNDQNLIVEEKLDGTLIILYYDLRIGWCVATGGVPDANLPIDGFKDRTFRSLFENAIVNTTNLSFSDFCKDLPREYTFCFELTSPFNRIVVEYKECKTTFLFARNNLTFLEENRVELQKKFYSLSLVPLPRQFRIFSDDQLEAFVNSNPANELEGCILFGGFGRVKVKSRDWLLASKTKDQISSSPRNFVAWILRGIDDDVRAILPKETCDMIDDFRVQINNIFTSFDENFVKWNHLATSRKNFAEFVNLHEGWKGPYFQLYEGKFSSVRNYVSSLLSNNKLSDTFIDSILKHVKVRPNASFNKETFSD